MAKDTRKRMSLAIDADLVAWCDYAAGIESTNLTGYINNTIRRDKEAASAAVLEGFKAFETARAETMGK